MPQNLPKNVFSFIWFFLRPYRIASVSFITLAVLAGLWEPLHSALIKHMIDTLALHGSAIRIVFLGVLIVLNFLVFDNVTWRTIGYIRYRFQAPFLNSITRTMMEKILDQSPKFFQDRLAGALSKQITTLTENIEIIVCKVSQDLLRTLAQFLISIVVCLSVNAIFCVILTVWFVSFVSFGFWSSPRLAKLANRQAETENILSGQLVDVLSNQNNVRIFAQKSSELWRMDLFLNKVLKAFRRKEFFLLILWSVQGGLIAALMGTSLYFLIHLFQLGLVTVGDFAMILGLSMGLGHIVWYTMSRIDDLNQAYGKCQQSLDSLLIPYDLKDASDARTLSCQRGFIEFKQVDFGYTESSFFFQKQSISIVGGQKVGLVGYSGSGKSTFINLILRLYDVGGGAVLIDGQDVRTVTQDSLHQSISLIPQDPSLFHRSVIENIRYGCLKSDDEAVIQAAHKAHAHEFIEKLPLGYDSLVGERGIRLSGGQRQRIAIARAILKNAPILIMDEATSQLDSITESVIQENLWNLMEGKTTLVIAHRLSTLLHMDRILVFREGKIMEDGTHSDLIAKRGLYKRLWDAQVGGFLGDNVTTLL